MKEIKTTNLSLVKDIKVITQETKILEDLVIQNNKMSREDLKKFIRLCNTVSSKFKIWKMNAIMFIGIKEEEE